MRVLIKPYESKYRDGVVEVLQYLWPWSKEERYARFDWEYYNNPSYAKPMAVVAVNEDDEVVGFRGWIPGLVKGNGSVFLIARAADAVVLPSCRKQGIFSKMTVCSLSYLHDNGVDAILNLTSNSQSNPGNIKLGWKSIGQLIIWYKIIYPHKKKELDKTIELTCDNHKIEIYPFIPEELRVNTNHERLAFSMNDGQLGWIGKMPGGKFITAVSRRMDGVIDNVFVFGVGHGRKTSLFYLEVNDDRIAKRTLRETYRFFTAGIVSVWGMALSERNARFLKKCGFTKIPFCEKLRKPLPILVRTVGDPEEQRGWFLGGNDIRNLKSWQLMFIDSF